MIGTTGFSQEQLSRIRHAIDGRVAAVISLNFSPGVNLFWKLLGVAAQALKDYGIEVIEAHHNQKKDRPEGKGDRSPCRDSWRHRRRPHGASSRAPASALK